jgi:hypothetical protein
MGGKPHFFDCRFSEELDDHPDQYQVWPAQHQELADALEAWRAFAQWRDQHDSGYRPPPFPGPRPANACKSAGTRVRLTAQELPFPNGAWTGIARSRAACRNTRSAGSSLTGLPSARRAA